MSKRQETPENYSFPAWRSPEMTSTRRVEMGNAAELHRQANPSDPFAPARIMTYMRRGTALPSEVASDARSQIEARERARS